MYQEEVNAAHAAAVPNQADGTDPVLACLVFLAQHYDRPSSPILLTHGLAVDEDGRLPFHQIERAVEHVGLRAMPDRLPLKKLRSNKLPAILRLTDGQAAVVLEEQAGDLLTGEEGFASEWKDLSMVTRLLQYRVLAEHPRLAELFVALQISNPLK